MLFNFELRGHGGEAYVMILNKLRAFILQTPESTYHLFGVRSAFRVGCWRPDFKGLGRALTTRFRMLLGCVGRTSSGTRSSIEWPRQPKRGVVICPPALRVWKLPADKRLRTPGLIFKPLHWTIWIQRIILLAYTNHKTQVSSAFCDPLIRRASILEHSNGNCKPQAAIQHQIKWCIASRRRREEGHTARRKSSFSKWHRTMNLLIFEGHAQSVMKNLGGVGEESVTMEIASPGSNFLSHALIWRFRLKNCRSH